MTLDQYNSSIKAILEDQQRIAQDTAKLAMTGQANPTNPAFAELMARQWALVQELARWNTSLMLGVFAPKIG